MHVLARDQVIDLPAPQVFDFFGSIQNLERLTPKNLRFKFRGDPPEMTLRAVIRYRVHIMGLPINWTTRITEWDPPHRFVDVQERGPYAQWTHTHIFEPLDQDRTMMRDRIAYSMRFGPLGEVANRLLVESQLRTIFAYREQTVSALLGADARAT